jgi:hypothetical protein
VISAPTTSDEALQRIRARIIARTTLTDQQVWIDDAGALGAGAPAIVLTEIASVPAGKVRRGATLTESRELTVQLSAVGKAAVDQLAFVLADLSGGDVVPDLAYRGEGAKRRRVNADSGGVEPIAFATIRFEHQLEHAVAAQPEADALVAVLRFGEDRQPSQELATVEVP